MDIISLQVAFISSKQITSKKDGKSFYVYRFLYNDEVIDFVSDQNFGKFKLAQLVTLNMSLTIYNSRLGLRIDSIE